MRKSIKLMLCAMSMTAFAVKIIAKDKIRNIFRNTLKPL